MITGVANDIEKFISSRRQLPPPDGYISKPVEEEKLLEMIKKLLN